MRRMPPPGSARAYVGEFRSRVAMQSSQVHDPFSVDPVRRSLIAVAVSLAVIVVPFMISNEAGATVMLSVGWLALAVLVFSVPVLVWSALEETIRALNHRIHPPVTDLDLPERVIHILHRHGIDTIQAAERLDPAAFHLMANMGPRDADAVTRAINLWRYRRWQEAGFPAGGGD